VTKVVGIGDEGVGRAVAGRQEPQEARHDLDRLIDAVEQLDLARAVLAALLGRS
jgi:hypothetical protein